MYCQCSSNGDNTAEENLQNNIEERENSYKNLPAFQKTSKTELRYKFSDSYCSGTGVFIPLAERRNGCT
jgi:hypothetical protein